MVIHDTVIPSSFDASSVDNVSIDLSNTNKVEVKQAYELNQITNPLAETELAVMELKANASITPLDNDTYISDTFSDSDGYMNTVAVGTTTAAYDSSGKKYKASATAVKDSRTDGSTDIGFYNPTYGVSTTFVAGSTYTCTRIDIDLKKSGSPSGNLTCYIYAVDGNGKPTGAALGTSSNVLDMTTLTTSYVYYSFTFAGVSLTSGTTYAIAISAPTVFASQCIWPCNNATTGKTYALQSGNWVSDGATRQQNFKTFAAAVTQIVDITLPAISGTVTHTQLVIHDIDRETGDSITYKLKNATQSDAGLSVSTKNPITNVTTAPTGIEITLTPKGGGTDGYPSLKSYCLKIWKA